MSAFLCSNRHLNAMLDFAAHHEQRFHLARGGDPLHANRRADALELGELVQSLNIDAMEERYFDYVGTDAPLFVRRPQSFILSPVQIIKLCQCWEYQCCGLESFETTDAARIVRNIRDMAINKLPGYSEAQWSLD